MITYDPVTFAFIVVDGDKHFEIPRWVYAAVNEKLYKENEDLQIQLNAAKKNSKRNDVTYALLRNENNQLHALVWEIFGAALSHLNGELQHKFIEQFKDRVIALSNGVEHG